MNFPYPVIKEHPYDFTNSTFSIKSIENNNDEYKIELELTNKELMYLIEKNKLSFVLHLEESETMYRKAYKFNELNYDFIIPSDRVRRRVDLSVLIVCNEEIRNFYSNDLDTIYEGISITYERNNIIGFTNERTIKIMKESDEIRNARSIFSLISDSSIGEIYELELTRETILIRMNEEDYKKYATLEKMYIMNNKNTYVVLMTILIMPSFVQALNLIYENPDDYRDYIWFDSLVDAFKNKNINLNEEFKKDSFDAYKLAQIVFDGVISDSISEMKYIHEGE